MQYLTPDEVEALARQAHAGQVDKAGRPYAEHLAAVAHGVRQAGGDAEQISAAWLHDAVEDHALSEEWLAAAALSPRTKELVRAMTKQPGEDPRAYAARLRATPGAVTIKYADMDHNCRPDRLARLDPETRVRLRQKYARMRRLLRSEPASPEPSDGDQRRSPRRDGDPGDAALLAGLEPGQQQAWATLAQAAANWRMEDDDYTWSATTSRPDGTLLPGHPVYSARVDDLVRALAAVGAVTPEYHWSAFPVPQLSWDETYPPGDAVRAATAVVRGERLTEGTIGTAYEDGTLRAITTALAAWRGLAHPATATRQHHTEPHTTGQHHDADRNGPQQRT